MAKNLHYTHLQAQVVKGQGVFIAHNATLIGKVVLENQVSVWYNAVIRADSDRIHIGARTNIQDGCVLHVDEGVPLYIGTDNVVGHGAILHGASIGNRNLIGMRATVMNHVHIGDNCIIGAHALVTEGTVVPEHSLVLGAPAKVIRQLTAEEMGRYKKAVESYLALSNAYLKAESINH